jgi:hypothetical protein
VPQPEIPARASDAAPDSGKNVPAFRRPAPKPKPAASGQASKPRLPVALIFLCLCVVYVGIRFYWR